MAKRTNQYHILYPLGVTLTENGAEILVQADAKELNLLLFHAGEDEPMERIPFSEEDRIGDVWSLSLEGYDLRNLEYAFEADGNWLADPSAKAVAGRKVWGAYDGERKVKARMPLGGFAWDDDKNPQIPYSESVIYRLHVRGFTKHESSHIRNKGTFAGVVQMIPYLKGLGVTAIELMPATEFDEVLMEKVPASVPGAKAEQKPNGKLNYWGYGPSFLYAPKASYGTGVMPVELEFKIMMKELHRSGMECIMELFFTGDEAPGEVLNVLRYWVEEYHVDGFKLAGKAPLELIAEDPFLKNTKLFAENWQQVLEKRAGKKNQGSAGAPKAAAVTVHEKNLAEYNDKFQMDMRRILKGDQGMVESLMYWTANNPADHAVINYMANTNGFTMMDMVSYEEKHNEANGEENRDGSDYNCTWNCGVEGETDNERILNLRKQQICNAFMLLLLSQGTPLIMAGDEFGNSQGGNNNAYCQDNETGWLDWGQLEENLDLFQTVKELIAFRKAHKAFHMDSAAK
ncbi:MAG: alpha-amylase, partial [Lachnospiraceae bacterium]|nr:alpha-amylase [Lachnospiraceae bacterium]